MMIGCFKSIDSDVERVRNLMDDLGVQGEIIRHEESGSSTEGAAEALEVARTKILKTLLWVSESEDYIGTVITGDREVDIGKLKNKADVDNLSLADRDKVKEITGFEVGGVPPFALVDRCPVYVDEGVFEQDFVVGAAGSEYAGVKFDPKELKKLDIEVVELCRKHR